MIVAIILGVSVILNIRLAYLVGSGYRWRKKIVSLDGENKILIDNKDK